MYMLGREVARLADGYQGVGDHIVEWTGAGSASGFYFYRLSASSSFLTRKMLLVR